MSDKGTREAFEKWMQDKAPKGIDIHSAWEVWLAALAHYAQSPVKRQLIDMIAAPHPSHFGLPEDHWEAASCYAAHYAGYKSAQSQDAQPVVWNAQSTLSALRVLGDSAHGETDIQEAMDFLNAAESIRSNFVVVQPAQQAPVSAQMAEEELHSAACDFLDRLRADAEFQMTCMDGTTNIVGVIKAAWKDSALLSTAHSQQAQVMTDTYVQTVPDKCDRIVWRNQYIHLPISTAHSSDSSDAALEQISQWAKAYPLDIFPEPDWKRSAQVLKDAGLSLDAISAANMRHVITKVQAIVDAALSAQEKGGE